MEDLEIMDIAFIQRKQPNALQASAMTRSNGIRILEWVDPFTYRLQHLEMLYLSRLKEQLKSTTFLTSLPASMIDLIRSGMKYLVNRIGGEADDREGYFIIEKHILKWFGYNDEFITRLYEASKNSESGKDSVLHNAVVISIYMLYCCTLPTEVVVEHITRAYYY